MANPTPITGVNILPGPSGNSFQTPYGPQKRIEGYIKGTQQRRPLAFKAFFSDVNTTWGDTVNIDIEANKRNMMGQYVDPDVDVYRVQLPTMGTKEFTFGYSKEAVGSPNYSEISQRMLAEQPGAVTLDSARFSRAIAENMQTQFSLAYERFENLYELARANILLYGTWSTTAQGANTGQHRPVNWSIDRDVLINGSANNQTARDANYDSIIGKNGDRIPQVDLTTLWANTTTAVGGGASWDSYDNTSGTPAAIAGANIKNVVSPVAQLNRMLEIAAFRAGTEAIFMSDDAYAWLSKDVNTNYATAANALYSTVGDRRVELDIMPYVKQIEGLVFRRMWNAEGVPSVPIYTYNGQYHDRMTGLKASFMPNGYVLLVPPSSYGAIRYGKIQHIKARWAAQQFWVNMWMNQRTGIEQYEIHTNFVVYHTDPNSIIAWKVCSTAPTTIFY